MKKLDYFLIGLYLIISISTGIYFSFANIDGYSGEKVVEIFSNNVLYATYNLPVKDNLTLEIHTESGYNTVFLEGDKVSIKESDCRDQICVKEGSISKPGEMIVCLPNKLLIQILGKDTSAVDVVSY